MNTYSSSNGVGLTGKNLSNIIAEWRSGTPFLREINKSLKSGSDRLFQLTLLFRTYLAGNKGAYLPLWTQHFGPPTFHQPITEMTLVRSGVANGVHSLTVWSGSAALLDITSQDWATLRSLRDFLVQQAEAQGFDAVSIPTEEHPSNERMELTQLVSP